LPSDHGDISRKPDITVGVRQAKAMIMGADYAKRRAGERDAS
jgi:hypothetical protein